MEPSARDAARLVAERLLASSAAFLGAVILSVALLAAVLRLRRVALGTAGARTLTVGFFHPYVHQSGGGELPGL